jgi:hypothetical protein
MYRLRSRNVQLMVIDTQQFKGPPSSNKLANKSLVAFIDALIRRQHLLSYQGYILGLIKTACNYSSFYTIAEVQY